MIEPRVNNLNGIDNVELSLVDARTGVELRTLSFEAVSHDELLTILSRKLDADFFVEGVGY